MRRFSAAYLSATREGMWADREALSDLSLSTCHSALDVGAGTGSLTQVLREETPGQVVALDADQTLLSTVPPPRVLGDATRLPVCANSFELVICQALLINLADPTAAVSEFVRATSDRVAAVEPDNSAVTVESSVETERELAKRARTHYLRGTDVNPALGAVDSLFADAGLQEIRVHRYNHVLTVEPPYTEQALESARRKASGAGIESDRETLRDAGLSADAVDSLRTEWREMGREVIAQMQTGEYRRRETIPFYVTSGRLSVTRD